MSGQTDSQTTLRRAALLWAPLFLLFCSALLRIERAIANEDEPTITVASPHWEGIRNELGTGFREHCRRRLGRPCAVRWLDLGGTVEIMRFLRSRFQVTPTGVDIDILFGGGLDPYIELKRLGHLQRHRPPESIISGIPPELGGSPLYDPEHYWHAATMAGFGIVYNKEVLKLLKLPPPQTWADLTAPQYSSWISSADPSKSGAAHMFYELILQAHGWDQGWSIIYGIAANVRAFGNTAGQAPRDVLNGEAAAGFSLDSYAEEVMRQGGRERIGFVLPRDASTVVGDGIALLKGAPREEEARAFIDFVLSDDGQKLLMLPKGAPGGPIGYHLGKPSVRPAVHELVEGALYNPFTLDSSFRYNSELGARRRTVVSDLLSVFVVNRHDVLKRAAAAMRNNSLAPTEQFQSPIPEEMALSLQPRLQSQEARNRLLAEWSHQAYLEHPEAAGGSLLLEALPTMVFLVLLLLCAFVRR